MLNVKRSKYISIGKVRLGSLKRETLLFIAENVTYGPLVNGIVNFYRSRGYISYVFSPVYPP